MEKLDVFGGVEKKQDLLTPEDHRIIKLRKDLIRVSLSENLIFNLGRKDKDGNYSDRNNGLVNFITSCGYDYKQYIRKYLRGLQPFMIVENKRRNQSDFSCIIDASYRIPLWIECYLNKNREQVISFHELNSVC